MCYTPLLCAHSCWRLLARHFGVTPDSNGKVIYHYHVQNAPPFTVGCFGPAISNGKESLVTLAQCRAAYSECGDGTTTVTSTEGTVQYDLFCPCFDGNGSNVGTVELAVFAQVSFPSSRPHPFGIDSSSAPAIRLLGDGASPRVCLFACCHVCVSRALPRLPPCCCLSFASVLGFHRAR